MRPMILAPLMAALAAGRAVGQEPVSPESPCPTPAPAAVRLEATVRADSMRVTTPGSGRVVLASCAPGGVNVDRGSLPETLVPGTTYRNVSVRLIFQADPVVACRLAAVLGVREPAVQGHPSPCAAAPAARTQPR